MHAAPTGIAAGTLSGTFTQQVLHQSGKGTFHIKSLAKCLVQLLQLHQ